MHKFLKQMHSQAQESLALYRGESDGEWHESSESSSSEDIYINWFTGISIFI